MTGVAWTIGFPSWAAGYRAAVFPTDDLAGVARKAAELPKRAAHDYDPEREVNLPGFAASMSVYAAAVTGFLALLRASGRDLPERYAVQDLVIGGLATHKLSRLLAKGSVTSPIRAPFTEFAEPAGSSEHIERPRGHGVRHTVGELLSCPFCLDVWIGTAYVAGLAVAPRATRGWGAVFSVVAGSDLLQHAYGRLRTD